MLTPDQKSLLFKDPDFLQQAGVIPKSSDTLSKTVNDSDIDAQFKALRAQTAPKVEEPVTPQYTAPKVAKTKMGEAITGIAKGGYETLKGTINTAETLLKEKAKQDIGKIPGLTALVNYASKKLGIELPKESVANLIQAEIEKKKNIEPGTLLKGNTPIERAFKTGTEVAAAFAPLGEGGSAASKAASLAKEAPKTAEQLLTKGINAVRSKSPVAIEKRALEAITPKTSNIPATEYTALSKSGKISPKTLTNEPGYVLSKEESALAKKYPKLLQSKDPVANTNSVMENLTAKHEELKPVVDKANKPLDMEKLKGNLMEELNRVAEKDMNVKEKDITATVDEFANFLKKKDLKELFEKRNAFTTGRTYEGMQTTQKAIDQAARRGIVKTLKEAMPKKYGKIVEEMKDMYNIADLLEYGVKGQKGKSAIQVWIKNNPTKAKAIGIGLGGGAFGSLIYSSLKQ